jgi:hypothetical protein
MGNSALRSAQTLYAPSRVLKRAHRSTIVYGGHTAGQGRKASLHAVCRSAQLRAQQRRSRTAAHRVEAGRARITLHATAVNIAPRSPHHHYHWRTRQRACPIEHICTQSLRGEAAGHRRAGTTAPLSRNLPCNQHRGLRTTNKNRALTHLAVRSAPRSLHS